MSLCNKTCAAALLAALVVTVAGLAQTGDRAEISGRVADETGAVLLNVSLELRHQDTGHQYAAKTGGTGDFLFPFLPAGSYTLTADSPGFSRLKMEGIRVELNQRLDLSLVLKVGGPETQITVAAEPNRIETRGPAVTHVIAGVEVRDLPILIGPTGRNPLDTLLLLVPGASSFGPRGPVASGHTAVSILGSPVQGIGYYTDGVDNYSFNSSNGGAVAAGPHPDALGEFSVLAHTFKAEAGSQPVLVHLQTKSGGNEFHGQARAIVLHPALTVRDFFDGAKRSLFSTYAGGGQLSGPVMLPGLYRGRDRTFFFVDVESTRSQIGYPARQPVLSNAQRAGDFAELPERARPRDPLSGQPFPGGVIPPSRILPQSRFYIDQFIPRPTEGSEWVTSPQVNPGGVQLSARVDHQFSPSRILSASVFGHTTSWDEPHWSTEGTLTKYVAPAWAHSLSVAYTHSFSPAAVNSFTFGRTDNRNQYTFLGKVDAPDLTRHGYNIRSATGSYTGFPQVTLFNTNMFDPGRYDYARVKNSPWTWRDDLSLHKGQHALKAGAEVRWLRGVNFFAFPAAPAFAFADFNPFGTGQEAADFLLGIPFSYSQGTDYEDYASRLLSAFYFQDDIKLKSNLTLNLGLRYELNGVLTDRDGRNAAFRPGATSSVFPRAPRGVIFPGDQDSLVGGTLGRALTPPDHNDFAPRFGIAWSPGGRTSIRAGYGLFNLLGRSLIYANEAPPWIFIVRRDAAEIRAAAAGFANPWGNDLNPFPAPLSERPFAVPLQEVRFVEPALGHPYQHQWSFSLARQLPKQVTVTLTYAGNRALHLTRRYEVNPGLLTPQATLGNIQSRRRYGAFGPVQGHAGDGVSVYHGLQAMVSRRFTPRLQLTAHYVWSKALDNNGGEGRNIWSQADREVTPWGRANFDRRHQFVLYSTAELPGFRGAKALRPILSGWQLAGIVQFRSGMPLNIRNGVDSTLQGITAGYPDITGSFRKFDPRERQSFRLPNGRTFAGNFLFDPTVFGTVQPRNASEARPGNLGRNVFSAPGMNNVDVSLLKRVTIREGHRVEIRADAANVFNHAQFTFPAFMGLYTSNANFGRTFGTFGPRRIQFVARYTF